MNSAEKEGYGGYVKADVVGIVQGARTLAGLGCSFHSLPTVTTTSGGQTTAQAGMLTGPPGHASSNHGGCRKGGDGQVSGEYAKCSAHRFAPPAMQRLIVQLFDEGMPRMPACPGARTHQTVQPNCP